MTLLQNTVTQSLSFLLPKSSGPSLYQIKLTGLLCNSPEKEKEIIISLENMILYFCPSFLHHPLFCTTLSM